MLANCIHGYVAFLTHRLSSQDVTTARFLRFNISVNSASAFAGNDYGLASWDEEETLGGRQAVVPFLIQSLPGMTEPTTMLMNPHYVMCLLLLLLLRHLPRIMERGGGRLAER